CAREYRRSTHFPYTTLFRSAEHEERQARAEDGADAEDERSGIGPRLGEQPPEDEERHEAREGEEQPGEDPAGEPRSGPGGEGPRSEEHTSELQSRENLVCRL